MNWDVVPENPRDSGRCSPGLSRSLFLSCSVASSLCSAMDWLHPARLLCPWDFPGKNTGVGCCFLTQVKLYRCRSFKALCLNPGITVTLTLFYTVLVNYIFLWNQQYLLSVLSSLGLGFFFIYLVVFLPLPVISWISTFDFTHGEI